MWIVRLALRRPYTFVVVSILVAIFGVLSALAHAGRHLSGDRHTARHGRVAVRGHGARGDGAARRSVRPSAFYSTTVSDIEHIESQSINGVGVIKIYFQPGRAFTRRSRR